MGRVLKTVASTTWYIMSLQHPLHEKNIPIVTPHDMIDHAKLVSTQAFAVSGFQSYLLQQPCVNVAITFLSYTKPSHY